MGHYLKINAEDVQLRQGDMDGACAVYSLMMGLIALGLITKDDVEDLGKKYGRSSKGRLIQEFLKKLPDPKNNKYDETLLLRNGYDLREIREKLKKSFNKSVESIYRSSVVKKTDENYMNKRELEEFIADEIHDKHPVEICYSYRGNAALGHAVLVVGYEEDEDCILTRFYCLDPGGEKTKAKKKYNSVIDLKHNGKRIQYAVEDERPVLIHSALSLISKE